MADFTAINVFVEVDGKQCIAMIDPAMASAFMHMLPAFQKGQPENIHLIALPDEVTEHLLTLRRTFLAHVEAAQAQKSQA